MKMVAIFKMAAFSGMDRPYMIFCNAALNVLIEMFIVIVIIIIRITWW